MSKSRPSPLCGRIADKRPSVGIERLCKTCHRRGYAIGNPYPYPFDVVHG